uniref:Uncharacterized protein n=1 Tax=Plectus sambesii TaxID=2011161 RepID=A0A914V978_9BILA
MHRCRSAVGYERTADITAQGTVFGGNDAQMNGGWSAWSAWGGSCEIDCGLLKERMRVFKESGRHMADALPKLTKSRTCTAPVPLNGGERCFGPEAEHKDCRTTCPVDGSWTDWSEWSQCSAECHKFRTRDCADPLPTNGGQHCIGRDLETRNCSGGYCKKSLNGSGDGAKFETSLAMYAGLGCALLLFVMIIALILWLICRRRRCGSRQKEQDIYYPHNSGKGASLFSK